MMSATGRECKRQLVVELPRIDIRWSCTFSTSTSSVNFRQYPRATFDRIVGLFVSMLVSVCGAKTDEPHSAGEGVRRQHIREDAPTGHGRHGERGPRRG